VFKYEGARMKTLRYSESFYSVQGEGNFVGTPSVFLRTFGCNFRCMNFGLSRDTPKGKINNEVQALLDNGVLETVDKFEDLPIVNSGCDTYASIYPQFKQYMKNKSAEDVATEVVGLTPNNDWITNCRQDIHFILTGGEPLLWQRFWPRLLDDVRMESLRNLTIETNTTQCLNAKFEDYLNYRGIKVTWACSPKLSISGEPFNKAIRPDVAKQLSEIHNCNMYFKFVVEDERDIEDVYKADEAYRAAKVYAPIYIMPLGGTTSIYNGNKARIADIALERGWRFSPRLQCELYGNGWGT
jgi:7-carboxy-7-deazaguanine synthase